MPDCIDQKRTIAGMKRLRVSEWIFGKPRASHARTRPQNELTDTPESDAASCSFAHMAGRPRAARDCSISLRFPVTGRAYRESAHGLSGFEQSSFRAVWQWQAVRKQRLESFLKVAGISFNGFVCWLPFKSQFEQ